MSPYLGNQSLVHISVQVENSSSREGAEVVQLYVGNERQAPDAPIRRLCGLQRVSLASGESRSLEFDLNLEDIFTRVGDRSGLVVSVGGGQPLGETPHVETRF